MAKIRHIAYRAEDVDAMAKFFVDAMGMTIKQKRKNTAVDLTDGTNHSMKSAGTCRRERENRVCDAPCSL